MGPAHKEIWRPRKDPYEKNNDEILGNTTSLEDAIRVMTLGGTYSISVSIWAIRTPFLHEKDREHAVEGFIKTGLPK